MKANNMLLKVITDGHQFRLKKLLRISVIIQMLEKKVDGINTCQLQSLL